MGVLLGHGACGWLGLPTGVMVAGVSVGQDESNLVLDAETGWGVALMQGGRRVETWAECAHHASGGARGPVAGRQWHREMRREQYGG